MEIMAHLSKREKFTNGALFKKHIKPKWNINTHTLSFCEIRKKTILIHHLFRVFSNLFSCKSTIVRAQYDRCENYARRKKKT